MQLKSKKKLIKKKTRKSLDVWAKRLGPHAWPNKKKSLVYGLAKPCSRAYPFIYIYIRTMIKLNNNLNIMFNILFIMHCNDNLKKKLKETYYKKARCMG